MAFDPFKSEDTSIQIGGLTVEGDAATVSLYGRLSITRDQAGLALAKDLHALLGKVVDALEAGNLPTALKREASTEGENPFL
jgi:hypothetical protein